MQGNAQTSSSNDTSQTIGDASSATNGTAVLSKATSAMVDAATQATVATSQANEETAYVAEWGARIDAYLAGSPLEGYGETFAKAAYEYGVDPRWSPAISMIESSKGACCFASHNAWGWGSTGWSDWDTAIYAHVEGLSESYGSTISESAAQKYCPPTWNSWYSNVSSEMDKI